ncbi:LamG domain-containing protein [Nanoarchaeota archaeon]
MNKKSQSELMILAIVGIVAVVGLIILFVGRGAPVPKGYAISEQSLIIPGEPEGDLAGQATEGITQSDLIAHYQFNNDVVDLTGTITGENVSGVVCIPGKSDQAAYFDGDGKYIQTIGYQSNLDYNKDWTVSMWFKADDASGVKTLLTSSVNRNNRMGIQIYNGRLRLTNYKGYNSDRTRNYASKSVFFSDTIGWHHVVMINQNKLVEGYLDGVRLTNTLAHAALTDTQGTVIGARTGFASPFKGSIDELKIFDVALSELDVMDLFNEILPPSADCPCIPGSIECLTSPINGSPSSNQSYTVPVNGSSSSNQSYTVPVNGSSSSNHNYTMPINDSYGY